MSLLGWDVCVDKFYISLFVLLFMNTMKINDFQVFIFKRYVGKMNKRGQFYLVAAMLIVLIMSGFAGVSSYALVNSEPETIVEISGDLSRESYSIIEYGLYNGKDVDELLTEFTGDQIGEFFLEKTQDANIIFVYGDKKDLKALQYESGSQGDISIGDSSWVSHTNLIAKIKNLGDVSHKNSVEVELLERNYNFDVRDNEIFYFVIVKERGDEIFVRTNEKKSDKDKLKDRKGGG
jgi:hypothetical protein